MIVLVLLYFFFLWHLLEGFCCQLGGKDKDNKTDKDNDPTAQASLTDVVVGKELVPFKQLDAKRKSHVIARKNSSPLGPIGGTSLALTQVAFLRKFCV